MANGKYGKHVIFLGAGASVSSGYPLANGLRLLMSSKKHWEEALLKYEEDRKLPQGSILNKGIPFWNIHEEALKLFRTGGFATLDEFCKLADKTPSYQHKINGLRTFVRAALGIFNPEDNFEKSDYYPFMQALFKEDLAKLREDITILTYNYDPYLEYLLHRALTIRRYVCEHGGPAAIVDSDAMAAHKQHEIQLNAVTSGFYSPLDREWLSNDSPNQSFCVLQLHGTICEHGARGSEAKYGTLFEANEHDRAKALFEADGAKFVPPIIFPWEILEKKQFIGLDKFFMQNRTTYTLFKGIWERAKREIEAARKISFVGLSVHPFLKGGLEYLFDGKGSQVEVVMANPLSANWRQTPSSPAYYLNEMLKEVAPNMYKKADDIKVVSDFSEFIKKEMNEVAP